MMKKRREGRRRGARPKEFVQMKDPRFVLQCMRGFVAVTISGTAINAGHKQMAGEYAIMDSAVVVIKTSSLKTTTRFCLLKSRKRVMRWAKRMWKVSFVLR